MQQYEKVQRICNIEQGDITVVRDRNTAELFIMKRVFVEERSLVTPEHEAQLLEKLHHPNIIELKHHFYHKRRFCLIMEYAQKGDIGSLIATSKVLFSQDQVLEIFCQLCLAVKYLHDNKCIHRDIKAHNVFLSEEGLVKLGDFGISIMLAHSRQLTNTQLGTPYYLSPEVAQGKPYDSKVDIWMTGCFLYELCTFKRPFNGKTWTEVENNIQNSEPPPIGQSYSPGMQSLINSMLQKDPKARIGIEEVLKSPEVEQKLLDMQQNEKFKGRLIFLEKEKPITEKKESISDLLRQAQECMKELSMECKSDGRAQKNKKFQRIFQGKQKQELNINSINSENQQHSAGEAISESNLNTPSQYQQSQQNTPLVLPSTTKQRVETVSARLTTAINENSYQQNQQQQQNNHPQSHGFPNLLQMPQSPNRTILFLDFLKQKLGKERFFQMKQLLQASGNPLKVLDERPQLVAEIIGPENMDCIKIFRCLITSSVTPPSSHLRARSTAQSPYQKQQANQPCNGGASSAMHQSSIIQSFSTRSSQADITKNAQILQDGTSNPTTSSGFSSWLFQHPEAGQQQQQHSQNIHLLPLFQSTEDTHKTTFPSQLTQTNNFNSSQNNKIQTYPQDLQASNINNQYLNSFNPQNIVQQNSYPVFNSPQQNHNHIGFQSQQQQQQYPPLNAQLSQKSQYQQQQISHQNAYFQLPQSEFYQQSCNKTSTNSNQNINIANNQLLQRQHQQQNSIQGQHLLIFPPSKVDSQYLQLNSAQNNTFSPQLSSLNNKINSPSLRENQLNLAIQKQDEKQYFEQ